MRVRESVPPTNDAASPLKEFSLRYVGTVFCKEHGHVDKGCNLGECYACAVGLLCRVYLCVGFLFTETSNL